MNVSDLTSLSRQQLQQGLDNYRELWGFERGLVSILQVFFITSLDCIRDLHNSAANELFCTVIRGMRELSETWCVERTVIKGLKRLLRGDEALLPEEIVESMTFDDDVGIAGHGPDLMEGVSSTTTTTTTPSTRGSDFTTPKTGSVGQSSSSSRSRTISVPASSAKVGFGSEVTGETIWDMRRRVGVMESMIEGMSLEED